MKNSLIILGLVVCASAVGASRSGTDELLVHVELTTGERSRDSSSQTTTLTVTRGTIVLEQTFYGRRSAATSPVRKEFKLLPAEKANLIKLIRSNNLLVTDSIELPQDGSNFRYFEILLDLTLDGKKGAINISGMRTAVTIKEERLYQNALALVKELYRIMNRQKRDVRFEELILEPIPKP